MLTLVQALSALRAIQQLSPREAPNKDQWAAVNRAAASLEYELSKFPNLEVTA